MAELLDGALLFVAYLLPLAVIIFTARKVIKFPDELFRKCLHTLLLGAYIPLLFGFETWWICVAFVLGLMLLLYPILMIISRVPKFTAFVNERKSGEFKSSMVLALGVMAGSIAIGWGIFNDKYLVLASVYCWGIGDAFAALIGKRFGKHKIQWKFVDNKKSYEGSLAMLVISMISVFIILMLRGGVHAGLCALIALVASAASAFVELCSKGGIDTVTCPAVSMAIILALLSLIGG